MALSHHTTHDSILWMLQQRTMAFYLGFLQPAPVTSLADTLPGIRFVVEWRGEKLRRHIHEKAKKDTRGERERERSLMEGTNFTRDSVVWIGQ